MKFLCYLIVLKFLTAWAARKPPHIIFLVADDLGWNDISWNNADIKSPHLEALARNGVILNQSYVLPICSPSRSAFFTGYYPFKTGRQNSVIPSLRPTGLSINYTLLPEKLKARGYSTHLVGKWHLGYCNLSYVPTNRGFDSFLGFYNGYENYFEHALSNKKIKFPFEDFDCRPYYLDFRKNTSPALEYNGTYSTEVFRKAVHDILSSSNPNDPLFLTVTFQSPHFPLEVPEKYEKMYPNIGNRRRRIFSGMVTSMDDAIGSIVSDLKKFKFWDNSVIIFTSDNGGQLEEFGNNYPLRGAKFSLWEGGTRVPGMVFSNLLSKKGYVSDKLIHAVDWYSTITYLAGIREHFHGDGVNQWHVLSKDKSSGRRIVVYNIYDHDPPHAAIRVGDYKLIQGLTTGPNCVIPVPKNNNYSLTCNEYGGTNSSQLLLFNLKNDPSESHNIANEYPIIVAKLLERLNKYKLQAVPADDPPNEPAGDPVNWGGIFSPGWCVAK